jgi:hypothetical protein
MKNQVLSNCNQLQISFLGISMYLLELEILVMIHKQSSQNEKEKLHVAATVMSLFYILFHV